MINARPADLLRAVHEDRDAERVAAALAAAVGDVGHGRAATIDAALGFAPGDVRRACRAQRDRLLRQLAAAMPADRTCWQRAGALAELVISSQHHRDACRRRGGEGQWRDHHEVGLLIEAERWHRLPRTAQGMHDVLRKKVSGTPNQAHPPAGFVRKSAA